MEPSPPPALEPSPLRWPSPRGSRSRRVVLSLLVGVLVVAFCAVWALPNIAGPTFLQVRAVAIARPAPATGPLVEISGGPAVQAAALNVTVEMENRYPLPVVVGAGPIAYRAAVYHRDGTGRLTVVWVAGVGDAIVEEGSDSPVGGGSAGGAAAVPSGITRHAVANGSSAFPLVDARGLSIGPGVYYLRVWGFGIGSPLVPLAIGGATDPAGLPTDLPPEPS